jgi:hypothetical protein
MLSGINASGQRPNQMAASPYGNKCTNDLIGPNPTCFWLNRAAFAVPAPGTVGSMRPGMLRGPGFFDVDTGLARAFRIKEAQRMEFRADATNVLNHTNFLNPGVAPPTAFTTLTSNNFGRLQQARDARVFQFALKYMF